MNHWREWPYVPKRCRRLLGTQVRSPQESHPPLPFPFSNPECVNPETSALFAVKCIPFSDESHGSSNCTERRLYFQPDFEYKLKSLMLHRGALDMSGHQGPPHNKCRHYQDQSLEVSSAHSEVGSGHPESEPESHHCHHLLQNRTRVWRGHLGNLWKTA